MTALVDVREISTTCPYCGVGCGVRANTTEAGEIVVAGDVDHPANRGSLCVKGSALAETLGDEDRLLYPEINGVRRSWDEAVQAVAEGFAQAVSNYGPDSVGFYLSGQLLTEDYYVANKLMKGFLGSANVDTNSRLCMASAVVAHKRAFGEDVVPCDYDDLDACELLVIVGANTAWTHPVVYQRIRAARERGGLKVVVIDPRKTATTELADLHLQLSAGDDLALFTALLSHLNLSGKIDHAFVQAHCSGFESALAACAGAGDSLVAGEHAEDVELFFKWFSETDRTVTLFSQGVNQSRAGTDTANAIINCHLGTGRIGRAGAGPFSITGQPNAMGGREVGGMANQLAGHMDFDSESVAAVAKFWNATNMAQGPGKKAVELFEALGRGEIKALWIMGTNPAVSLPDSVEIEKALAACDFLVVSDCVADTATLRHADVRLPALGWGEKDGTVTNSERVVSRQRAFLSAPGAARADWRIICDVARAMGFESEFNYPGPGAVFKEHAELTGVNNNSSRQLDLTQLTLLDDSSYDNLVPTRWPLNRRPFESADGLRFSTADGRAKFVPTPQTHKFAPAAEGELVVNSGRYRDQWHTMTRTGRSERLYQHRREALVEVHPDDAQRFDVCVGDLLELSNESGAVCLSVEISEDVRPGSAFVPIHWSARLSSSATVNKLYPGITDPYSGQPESKYVRASARAVDVEVWGRLFVADRRGDALPWEECAVPEFWVRSRVRGGWSYLLAGLSGEVAPWEQLTEGCDVLSFVDEAAGTRRWMGRQGAGLAWHLWTATSRSLLPEAEALTDLESTPSWNDLTLAGQCARDYSPVICTCYEVRKNVIESAIANGCCTEVELGERLGCGTQCGSCRPELRRLCSSQSLETQA